MNARSAGWKFVCGALAPGGGPGAEMLRHLLGRSDEMWPYVVRMADAQLVTPGVWQGLVRKGIAGELPEEPRRYLSSVYGMNRERNIALLDRLDEIIRVLNREGIVPLLLKGASYMKAGVYADPGTRILGDLDLLVAERDARSAFAIVEGLGYRHDGQWKSGHHCPLLYLPDDVARVEIHWRHFPGKCDEVLPGYALWSRAVARDDGGLRYSVPSPNDAVLASFLHSQIMDGLGEMFIVGLRAFQDLFALEAAYGAEVDWEALRSLTGTHGQGRRFRDYLYAADRLAPGRRRAGYRAGVRERLHYAACRARIRWEKLDYVIGRYNGFSAFHLRRKYGPTESFLMLQYYRIREAIEAVRRRRIPAPLPQER